MICLIYQSILLADCIKSQQQSSSIRISMRIVDYNIFRVITLLKFTFLFLLLPRVFFLELPISNILSLPLSTFQISPSKAPSRPFLLAPGHVSRISPQSLALSTPSEEAATTLPAQSHSSAVLIEQLQAEIKHLHQVIALKDQTLEEIRTLVERRLATRQGINSFEIVEKGLQDASSSGRYSEGLRRSLTYEISAEIDQTIGDSFAEVRQEFQRIFHYHSTVLEFIKDNYHPAKQVPPASIRTPILIEIPVEVRLVREIADQAIQVDLFESPKNSENQEIGMANRILRGEFTPQIREVAVEKDIYEIPVDVYVVEDITRSQEQEGTTSERLEERNTQVQDEIESLKTELERLNLENQKLKDQIHVQTFTYKQSQLLLQAEVKSMQKDLQGSDAQNLALKDRIARIQDEPFQLEIQISAPYLNFSIDQDKNVEVPIEFELENQVGSTLKMEVVREEQQVSSVKSYNEETRPNIVSEASLPKQRPEIQTRSEISEENRSGKKQGSIILSEESQSLKAEVPVGHLMQTEVVRIIEVPVVRIVEVPVEVIKLVEVIKYIEVPIATLEEVEVYSIMPVEVEVETERIVEVPVLHQIPVELILLQDQRPDRAGKLQSSIPEQDNEDGPIEIEVELEIDEFDLPVEVSVMERVVERVIEKIVEVEKVVYVDRPIEVVKTVFVERIVEVPVEVLVQKVVEYETIIERTNEVFIQKSKEVIIDRNVIREIPVEMQMDQNRLQSLPVLEEAEPVTLQTAPQDREQAHSQIQITDIEFIYEEESPKERVVVQIVQKIVEVPIQIFIERVVEVVKVVEVQVIQIVQVPVELQQEVKIIERYQPYLVEVPIELKTNEVMEVPVEMVLEPLIYEVPVDVVNSLEVLEIPLEMQEPPIVIEVPVEMHVLETEQPDSPRNKRRTSGRTANEQCESPTVRLALKNQPENTQNIKEQVYVVPLSQTQAEIEIEADPRSPNCEIIVEIPYEVDQKCENFNAETQTEQKKQQCIQLEEINVSKEDQQFLDTLNLLESAEKAQEKVGRRIQIIEVAVQVEVDNSEEIRKALEHKYRDRINDLHGQYSTEIASLHEMLQTLQGIILEAHQEREHLKDELESKALQEESLNNALNSLEDTLRQKEDAIREKESAVRLKEEETAVLSTTYQQQTNVYQELRQKYASLASDYNELQNEPPILYEMAVEMVIRTDRDSVSVQTEDLPLPNDISVIEVPVEIEVVEKISESSLRRSEDEEAKSSSTNNKYFKGYTEEELYEKLKAMTEAMTVKAELIDHFTQTEKQETVDDLADFEVKTENQLNITEMFDAQFIKDDRTELRNYKFYGEMESMREDHLISGIESIEEYENIIDLKIYEYAVEVFPEPVIYEVPIDLRLFKELSISEVQTEDVYSPSVLQKEIREVPVELNLKRQTVESGMQTEVQVYIEDPVDSCKNNQIISTDMYDNLLEDEAKASRARLLNSSNGYESRFIEIPIEMNIQVEKEIVCIDIQTKQTWNEVGRQEREELKPRPQQSKLKITPAFQQTHNASSNAHGIATGNPYQINNVMRLQSACFSIPENRILALASNNQSLTYDQFYEGLRDTQKLLDSNNTKALIDSADIREIVNQETVNHEIIVEEHDVYSSRVAVHIEDNNEMQFHEIGELNEAPGKGSEIKPNYSEIYENGNNQVEKYQAFSQQIEQENAELKQELQNLQSKYDEEIKRLYNQNAHLERTISEHQRIIQDQKGRLTEFSFMKTKEQKKLEKLEEEYEKMKGYNTNLEFSSNKEIERLQTIINDKIQEIKDLKIEDHQTKEIYEAQIIVLRSKLANKDEIIDELEQENSKKLAKIQQMIEYQDELRKAVAYAKQNNENSAAALYEQQFERIKDDFQEKKRQFKEQVIACNQDIQSLKQQIQIQSKRNRALNEEVQELQTTIVRVQEEYLVLLNVKGELQSNYVENLKEFNIQLQECRELISEKDKIIQNLQTNSENIQKSPYKLRQANPQINEEPRPTMRMQYLSRKMSRQAQDPRFVSTYIQKLEKLLLRYERIMAGNESTIEELQEKVCEYLRDALEKEQEAEMLYSKLVEYECAMNNILVEKITLEIENKRMGKAVELSERKVLILGNKLIEAVGRRQLHESQDSDYYYQ